MNYKQEYNFLNMIFEISPKLYALWKPKIKRKCQYLKKIGGTSEMTLLTCKMVTYRAPVSAKNQKKKQKKKTGLNRGRVPVINSHPSIFVWIAFQSKIAYMGQVLLHHMHNRSLGRSEVCKQGGDHLAYIHIAMLSDWKLDHTSSRFGKCWVVGWV